jgi:hypothetical protein
MLFIGLFFKFLIKDGHIPQKHSHNESSPAHGGRGPVGPDNRHDLVTQGWNHTKQTRQDKSLD